MIAGRSLPTSTTGSRRASGTFPTRTTADGEDEMADPRERVEHPGLTRAELGELRRELASVRDRVRRSKIDPSMEST